MSWVSIGLGRRQVRVISPCSVLLVLASFACAPNNPPPPRVPKVIEPTELTATSEWTLTWSDEFNQGEGSPPDPEKWTYDLGGHGWGNAQLEENTDRLENVSHTGAGHLAITAIKERRPSNEYSSARIKTQGLFELQYGRVEARMKLPTGQGIWPAFWMLGATFEEEGWPDCGEIDIMEHRGQRVFESTGAVHGRGFSAGESIGGSFTAAEPLHEDFHDFVLEWSPDELRWYVDQERFLTVRPDQLPKDSAWPFQRPFFLLLNLAVGGHYVGAPDALTRFPQQLLIDYVRVYQPALPAEQGGL